MPQRDSSALSSFLTLFTGRQNELEFIARRQVLFPARYVGSVRLFFQHL